MGGVGHRLHWPPLRRSAPPFADVLLARAAQNPTGADVEFSILGSLTEPDRRRVLTSTTRRRFGRREVLFHESDPGDTLHLIAKGRLAVRITTPSGDLATIDVLGPGEVVGMFAALGAGRRRADHRDGAGTGPRRCASTGPSSRRCARRSPASTNSSSTSSWRTCGGWTPCCWRPSTHRWSCV